MAVDLYGDVRDAVRAAGLIPAGSGVAVAVSGGVDSVVLLDVLARLAPAEGWRLVVVHVDHALREDSEADARFVEALAAERSLPIRTRRIDVAALAAARGESVEVAGRSARYQFFAEVCWDEACACLATAHTASDQAETFLMRLIRGTGLDGLAGIPLRRPLGDAQVEVVRPLLALSREQILAHARARDLDWREDPTNVDTDFTRNRIRAELLPWLRELNPRIDEALARAAAHLADDSAVLAALDEELLTACVDGDALVATRLEELAPPLRARVVRRFLRSLRAGALPPPAHEVRAVLSRFRSRGERWELHLSAGVRVAAEAGRLMPGPSREHSPAAETLIDPDGETEVPELGIRLSWRGDGAPLRLAAGLEPVLTVGPPLPGERLRPQGLGGSKKLSDLLIDRKIAASQRPRVPVIRSAGSVLAVLPPGGGPPLAVDESAVPRGASITLRVTRL